MSWASRRLAPPLCLRPSPHNSSHHTRPDHTRQQRTTRLSIYGAHLAESAARFVQPPSSHLHAALCRINSETSIFHPNAHAGGLPSAPLDATAPSTASLTTLRHGYHSATGRSSLSVEHVAREGDQTRRRGAILVLPRHTCLPLFPVHHPSAFSQSPA